MRRLLLVCLVLAACKRPGTEEARVAADAAAPENGGGPPGVVVDHVEASTRTYVGSPSLAILPDGTYVASHDFFGPGSTEDRTVVFGSTDRGAHWSPRADFRGQWWSTLFVQGGALYILGTSKQFGHVVIRRSSDGGRTWTTPDTPHTGKLSADAGFHCAPTPVVEHKGRLWRAFEHEGHPFHPLVISAPVNADLLDAASWKFSAQTDADTSWLGGHFLNWLEGNVVVGPGDALVDVLRVNSSARDEHAAIAHVAGDGASLTFDPNADFAALPGGSKKLTIRFDPKTNLYFTLANAIAPPAPNVRTDFVRNTLALLSSPDLRAWTERAIILQHPDHEHHGFHYVDWLFDGDDLVFVSRTAFDDASGGAHTYHDANYLTFHRIAKFRDAKGSPAPAPQAVGSFAVTGSGFELATLDEGQRAFSNRKYVWQTVPAALRGLRYTRVAGGESSRVHVKASRDGTIFAAAKADAPAGFSRDQGALVYDDAHKTELTVYRRAIKKDEELDLPQTGGWSQWLLILPRD